MMNKDFISIKNLKVFAHHGVLPEETRDGQDFYVDAKLYTDLREAGKSDELEKTVDYGDVCIFINTFLSTNTYKLIESAAQRLADALLVKYSRLNAVDITIHKPSAPIPLDFKDVSVNITRKWNEVYLGIGSNLGDRAVYISEALCKLKRTPGIRNVKCSKLIETKPYGVVEQNDFLNGAVRIETLFSPEELLEQLHRIENEAGRTREVHWGPRTLDLDILFYENVVMSTKELTIPHPDMENRDFVLEPLMELCPYYVNRGLNKTVKQMYMDFKRE